MILLIIICIIVTLCIFTFIRLIIGDIIENKVVDAINRYTNVLRKNNKYKKDVNYLERMMFPFEKYFLSIWKWTTISMIKPKYRKILKEYLKIKECDEYEI